MSNLLRRISAFLIQIVFRLDTFLRKKTSRYIVRHDNYRLYFIDHTRKCIYVENPKAASRSILDSIGSSHLRGREGITCSVPVPHLAIAMPHIFGKKLRIYTFGLRGLTHEMRDTLQKKEIDTYFSFTFVRNPFDRVVSGYTNKIISDHPIHVPGNPHDTDWSTFLGVAKEELNTPAGFKVFLEKYVLKFDDVSINVHFKQQYSIIEQHNPKKLDFIGRVESLDTDWHFLHRHFSFPKDTINVLNPSVDRKPYQAYYADKETIELVYARYQDDVERYGYEHIYRTLLHEHDK